MKGTIRAIAGLIVLMYSTPGAAPAQAAPPSIALGNPVSFGTGCPQGTVSSTLSPDQKALSLIFDRYTVQAGKPDRNKKARKGCQVLVPVQVPRGRSLILTRVDYRGFNALPAKAKSHFTHQEGFFTKGRIYAKTRLRTAQFKGPVDDNFILSDRVPASIKSKCGGTVYLALATDLRVETNAALEQAYTSLDSMDISAAKIGAHRVPRAEVFLTTVRCKGN